MIANELTTNISDYIHNGEIQGESFITGDYKEGNKAYNKMVKIVNKIQKTGNIESFLLSVFRSSEDANTLTCCCVQMLKSHIQPKLALKKLEEMKKSDKIHPVLVFNIKMFLQEWDKGNIKQ